MSYEATSLVLGATLEHGDLVLTTCSMEAPNWVRGASRRLPQCERVGPVRQTCDRLVWHAKNEASRGGGLWCRAFERVEPVHRLGILDKSVQLTSLPFFLVSERGAILASLAQSPTVFEALVVIFVVRFRVSGAWLLVRALFGRRWFAHWLLGYASSFNVNRHRTVLPRTVPVLVGIDGTIGAQRVSVFI
jgi:hypothetical protein